MEEEEKEVEQEGEEKEKEKKKDKEINSCYALHKKQTKYAGFRVSMRRTRRRKSFGRLCYLIEEVVTARRRCRRRRRWLAWRSFLLIVLSLYNLGYARDPWNFHDANMNMWLAFVFRIKRCCTSWHVSMTGVIDDALRACAAKVYILRRLTSTGLEQVSWIKGVSGLAGRAGLADGRPGRVFRRTSTSILMSACYCH